MGRHWDDPTSDPIGDIKSALIPATPDVPAAPEGETQKMLAPFRCEWCGHIHDAANVTVLGRYVDCSVWACPNCGVKIDDRPRAWGGRATDLRRQAKS